MKVRTTPNWLQLAPQQQIVFDTLFKAPGRCAEYSVLFASVQKQIAHITKPRLSDMLRSLEAKKLVERTNPKPSWRVVPEAAKRLSEEAVKRGKIRKGEDE